MSGAGNGAAGKGAVPDRPRRWVEMYEARARSALADARAEERAGRPAAAAVFQRQHDEDMQLARDLRAEWERVAPSPEPEEAAP